MDSKVIDKNKVSKSIDIEGAEMHNLKSIDLKIPKKQLVVITGLSGSGKSSLAFDTIYAEVKEDLLKVFHHMPDSF